MLAAAGWSALRYVHIFSRRMCTSFPGASRIGGGVRGRPPKRRPRTSGRARRRGARRQCPRRALACAIRGPADPRRETAGAPSGRFSPFRRPSPEVLAPAVRRVEAIRNAACSLLQRPTKSHLLDQPHRWSRPACAERRARPTLDPRADRCASRPGARGGGARGSTASVRLSGEFHTMLVDALGNPELSRFMRELLARSSLMVSAFEPARLSPCGVDEHAAIAAALREATVSERSRCRANTSPISRSGSRRGSSSDRSGRSRTSMPLAGEVGLSRARMRRPVKPIERAGRSLPTPARRL